MDKLTRRKALVGGGALGLAAILPNEAGAVTSYVGEGFDSSGEERLFRAFVEDFVKTPYYARMWDIFQEGKIGRSPMLVIEKQQVFDLLEKHPAVQAMDYLLLSVTQRPDGFTAEFTFLSEQKPRVLRRTTTR